MFFKNNTQSSFVERNEYSINGNCYINSGFSSFQEILILYIKEIAFYILKLKRFCVKNDIIRDKLLDILLSIFTNVSYKNNDFEEIIGELKKISKQAKNIYKKCCLEKELLIERPSFYFKHSKNYTLTTASIKGEKFFLKNIMNADDTTRGFHSILYFLAKTFIIKIVEIQRLGGNYDDFYYNLLEVLNVMLPTKFDISNIQKIINNTIENIYLLSEEIFDLREKKYGKPELTKVSLSSRENKAIMVSGRDIKKLEEVLQAAKNQKIDIYTQGAELLFAHAYPKIKSYTNLYGHFGESFENCISDFSSFPGVTLLSKDSLDCVEHIFRGRLFTIDSIASKGITKIENRNYSKLINDAKIAKGFKHNHQKGYLNVGFDEKIIYHLKDIFDKLLTKKIKHLYIIGLKNYNKKPNEYFTEFFNLLTKDCYALSFAYKIDKPNVYHIDSNFDYLLFHKLVKILNDKSNIQDLNLSVFVTKTDKQTIFNLLFLKYFGIKNVYFADGTSTSHSEILFDVLEKFYDIKRISTPKTDIKNTLNS